MASVDLEGLDPNRMPVHVACVMDGNGRWAQKRGLPRTEGHRAGEEALFDAIKGALELGISWFTVYAFSTENWRRPPDEVRFLLSVISDQLLLRRRDELNRMGVQIRLSSSRRRSSNWSEITERRNRTSSGGRRQFSVEKA